MSKPMTEIFSPDYAQFTMDKGEFTPSQKMQKKLDVIPIPDLSGKRVLDVGCDFGQFSFYSAINGASYVLGLDRNRFVKGIGQYDLVTANSAVATQYGLPCEFKQVDLGKQWFEFEKFDVIYVLNLYHHIYENCADHKAIWFWLYRHCNETAEVIWESPTDFNDGVSDAHISGDKRSDYSKEKIFDAASIYFDVEYVGQGHVETRSVYKLKPKKLEPWVSGVFIDSGAGGASKAFQYQNGRRMREIASTLGYVPFAGSLNCVSQKEFDWTRNYYRAKVLDVTNRALGLDGDWSERWARFYPVKINGVDAHAFKFEGESYPSNFIEIIAFGRLRSFINDVATVTC